MPALMVWLLSNQNDIQVISIELTSIDGVPLVGVNNNTEEARVSVDELGLEADL